MLAISGLGEQGGSGVALDEAALVEDGDAVVVDDRVEPVGDGENLG
jgi:hypothetical protein